MLGAVRTYRTYRTYTAYTEGNRGPFCLIVDKAARHCILTYIMFFVWWQKRKTEAKARGSTIYLLRMFRENIFKVVWIDHARWIENGSAPSPPYLIQFCAKGLLLTFSRLFMLPSWMNGFRCWGGKWVMELKRDCWKSVLVERILNANDRGQMGYNQTLHLSNGGIFFFSLLFFLIP